MKKAKAKPKRPAQGKQSASSKSARGKAKSARGKAALSRGKAAPAKASARAKAGKAAARGKPAKPARGKATKPAGAKSAKSAKSAKGSGARWIDFVKQHGVVLASARGPVPCVAEAVAGEPIVGSWWAHPKGSEIFEALSAIDDSPDVRCFKLVDGKVTLVHRKAWPALVRLGRDGVIAPEQLAAVQQEHTPSGEHRNIVTPFPDWVDDDIGSAADALSTEQARGQLAWIEG